MIIYCLQFKKGFGKTQWIMLLTCGMLLMFVINETMGIGIIIIASQCDFSTTSVDKAILGAAAFIGKLRCCATYKDTFFFLNKRIDIFLIVFDFLTICSEKVFSNYPVIA